MQKGADGLVKKCVSFLLRPLVSQPMEIMTSVQNVLFIVMQLKKGVTCCLPDYFKTPVIAH